MRPLGLPQPLAGAVVRALPAGATELTIDLLVSAIRQWGARRQEGTGAVSPALADAWRQAGGTVTELERLRAMFRYRRVRQSLAPFADSATEMLKATDELRSFWVTTGHDVEDLDRYMAGVDAEFPDIIPG
jgi:hypothetical protein